MGTVIVGSIVFGAAALIIRKMIMDKKSGKSHCSGDCTRCGGGCGH